MMRAVVLVTVIMSSQSAIASTNATILDDASRILSKWLEQPTETSVRHGSDCRAALKIITNASSDGLLTPQLEVDTFDVQTWRTEHEFFRFEGRNEDHGCSMTVDEKTLSNSMEVECRWQECEEEGCVDTSKRFRVETKRSSEPGNIWWQLSLSVGNLRCSERFEPSNG